MQTGDQNRENKLLSKWHFDSSVLLGRNQQQQIKAEKEEVVLTIFQCSFPLH
jgi:hypothetical protein